MVLPVPSADTRDTPCAMALFYGTSFALLSTALCTHWRMSVRCVKGRQEPSYHARFWVAPRTWSFVVGFVYDSCAPGVRRMVRGEIEETAKICRSKSLREVEHLLCRYVLSTYKDF